MADRPPPPASPAPEIPSAPAPSTPPATPPTKSLSGASSVAKRLSDGIKRKSSALRMSMGYGKGIGSKMTLFTPDKETGAAADQAAGKKTLAPTVLEFVPASGGEGRADGSSSRGINHTRFVVHISQHYCKVVHGMKVLSRSQSTEQAVLLEALDTLREHSKLLVRACHGVKATSGVHQMMMQERLRHAASAYKKTVDGFVNSMAPRSTLLRNSSSMSIKPSKKSELMRQRVTCALMEVLAASIYTCKAWGPALQPEQGLFTSGWFPGLGIGVAQPERSDSRSDSRSSRDLSPRASVTMAENSAEAELQRQLEKAAPLMLSTTLQVVETANATLGKSDIHAIQQELCHATTALWTAASEVAGSADPDYDSDDDLYGDDDDDDDEDADKEASGNKEDAPKDDAPKDDAPKDDAPKDDAAKDDAAKDDTPKDDAPVSDLQSAYTQMTDALLQLIELDIDHEMMLKGTLSSSASLGDLAEMGSSLESSSLGSKSSLSPPSSFPITGSIKEVAEEDDESGSMANRTAPSMSLSSEGSHGSKGRGATLGSPREEEGWTSGVLSDEDGEDASAVSKRSASSEDVSQSVKDLPPLEDMPFWDEPPEGSGSKYEVFYKGSAPEDETGLPRRIYAGSLNKIIARITHEKGRDEHFQEVFLTTYLTFATPEQVLVKLKERYAVPPPPALFYISDEEWQLQTIQPIQEAVMQFLQLWIDRHFEEFGRRLVNDIKAWVKRILSESAEGDQQIPHRPIVERIASSLETKLELLAEQRRGMRIAPQINVQVLQPLDTTANLSRNFILLQTEAEDIAHQMSLVELGVYSAIKPNELLNNAWSKSHLKHRSPNVLAMIQRFNMVSEWVASSVLWEERIKERARLFGKFVRIAEALCKSNNFNAMLAVTSGLTCSAVHRLKWTRKEVPKSTHRSLRNLIRLMSPDLSYKNYREALANIEAPCVPYLGVYLTDLTFLEQGNPDTYQQLINVHKREMVHSVIEQVLQYQNTPYTFALNEDLYAFLNELPRLEETALYKLSLEREPRGAERNEIM